MKYVIFGIVAFFLLFVVIRAYKVYFENEKEMPQYSGEEIKVKITKITKERFKELYDASAFTVEGADGSLDDWFIMLNQQMKKMGIGEVSEMFTFTGKDMNEHYKLTGNNAYQDDLIFLSFKLDNLNKFKLTSLKRMRLQNGDWLNGRWFDDIVDNNEERERNKNDED
ncbi:MAG: hypothetical protein FWD54_05840 [Endomicrobia bacterium]|nr:hypothetical protein [Endomicrobiia bacterium]MCL2799775.1 hypothetical protein [Endomicrobiia bacterium]